MASVAFLEGVGLSGKLPSLRRSALLGRLGPKESHEAAPFSHPALSILGVARSKNGIDRGLLPVSILQVPQEVGGGGRLSAERARWHPAQKEEKEGREDGMARNASCKRKTRVRD